MKDGLTAGMVSRGWCRTAWLTQWFEPPLPMARKNDAMGGDTPVETAQPG